MLLLLLPSAVADVPVRGSHWHALRSGGACGARGGGGGGMGSHGMEVEVRRFCLWQQVTTVAHPASPWTPKIRDFSGIWVTGGGVGMPRRCQKICLWQPPEADF